LLHIPDDIRNCGSLCITWSFYMEQYCSFLKHALQSRSQPWRNLDKRVKALAYQSQLRVKGSGSGIMAANAVQ
ncbi:uncharacterized protein PHACADRAFT_82341, partial [Phanerochaete carnosa HHB-10118-sp]